MAGARRANKMEEARTPRLTVLDLPEEVLVIIVSLLPFEDLVRVEATNSYFRALVIKHKMYKQLYRTTIPSYPSTDYLVQENLEDEEDREDGIGCFDTRSEEEESTALLENLSTISRQAAQSCSVSFTPTCRHYKLKIFNFLKPEHYHCKGTYDYYIQV